VKNVDDIIKILISRRENGELPITLLAVCPNSMAVLEAAVKAAAKNRSLMLFAATLNQVDFEESYTGWTPAEFVGKMHALADKYEWTGPLYPCLDHGGPWLKDLHTLANLSYDETMQKVKTSLATCVLAGYRLLHIDPTVDRRLPAGQPVPLEQVVTRTVELIEHVEAVRIANKLPGVAYEVGTEEVHGGLVDLHRFTDFLDLLEAALERKNLAHCWPCLLVAQIGTDLHTTTFQPAAARQLFSILSPHGSLAKGHYTDWVETPEEYPSSGMGAANVGPEFTAVEVTALQELDMLERSMRRHLPSSNFMNTLHDAVVESGRWKKWLLPGERDLPFEALLPARQEWLLETGSRYIWTQPQVIAARGRLYYNLNELGIDAHTHVLERIMQVIEKYLRAFNLINSIETLNCSL
jgi:D-tagatose-1,6-bisphosphate aldolase subunit GatZ/KbaZ